MSQMRMGVAAGFRVTVDKPDHLPQERCAGESENRGWGERPASERDVGRRART